MQIYTCLTFSMRCLPQALTKVIHSMIGKNYDGLVGGIYLRLSALWVEWAMLKSFMFPTSVESAHSSISGLQAQRRALVCKKVSGTWQAMLVLFWNLQRRFVKDGFELKIKNLFQYWFKLGLAWRACPRATDPYLPTPDNPTQHHSATSESALHLAEIFAQKEA